MYSQRKEHELSLSDPAKYWSSTVASLPWTQTPKTTLAVQSGRNKHHDDPHEAWQWFADGALNMCDACLDTHVKAGRGDVPAILYDSPVTSVRRTLSYSDLLSQVQCFAGVLRGLGVGKGDRVMIYMPMIPAAVVAMLACARLAAVHAVVFGGFAPRELAARMDDAEANVIVTASAGIEARDRVTPYLPLVRSACALARKPPKYTVLCQRDGYRDTSPAASAGGDDCLDWDTLMRDAEPVMACVSTQAQDALYILYTSGTTGAPKGVLRTAVAYAVHLKHSITSLMNLQPGQVMFCASDIGWVVGHTYIVYAPLLGGCSTVLFEGKVPMLGGTEVWRACEAWRVNVLFCAPTALRALRSVDPDHAQLKKRDLRHLRTLMLAGERSEPSIVIAYADMLQSHIGAHVRVVDNYWSSESGSPITGVLQSLADAPPGKPGSAGPPTPGYDVRIVNDEGREMRHGTEGNVVLKMPLPPSMLTALWRDTKGRFDASYLRRFRGQWFDTGDAGKIDEDGFVHILSRSDDVINVAAHRLSTGSFEAVIASLEGVTECCVVGMPDEIKGHLPVALIVAQTEPSFASINAAVRREIGSIASLGGIIWLTTPLPKTRSGKTLRRTCRSYVENAVRGDWDKVVEVPATIEDPAVLVHVQKAVREFVAKRSGQTKL